MSSQLERDLTAFTAETLTPAIEVIETTGAVPEPVIDEAAELGLFGLSIPREYGGLGLDLVDKCRLEEILGGTHYGFATVLGNHNGVGTAALVELGSVEQHSRYLPQMATGALRGAFCLTEPGAGSDAAAVATTAEPTATGWVLNGHKTLITQAVVAGLFTVTARTPRGLTSFLVERGNPGVRVGAAQAILGLRGSTVADVFFEDCELPGHALLGTEGRGLRQALNALNRGRIAMTARALGLGEAALRFAVEYAQEREQFGRKLMDNQGLAWRFAELTTELAAGRALLYRAAERIDAGEYEFRDVAMAKYYVTEVVGRVVDHAVQILGGIGYTTASPVERYFRDARVTRIYEGSSEVQLDVIARSLRTA